MRGLKEILMDHGMNEQVANEIAEEYRIEIRAKVKEGQEKARQAGRNPGPKLKDVNVPRAVNNLNKGLSKTAAAAIEHVSVGTLNNRLDKAGVEKIDQKYIIRIKE
jgi:DNA invertase Pin-like site-specific DNA recombinase